MVDNGFIELKDALSEVDRFSGYLDEDMILRIKIGLKRRATAIYPGCKWCTRKRKFESDGEYWDFDNEETIASGNWTGLAIGVSEDDKIRITAIGDGRADYFPKYCPECGRSLRD